MDYQVNQATIDYIKRTVIVTDSDGEDMIIHKSEKFIEGLLKDNQ